MRGAGLLVGEGGLVVGAGSLVVGAGGVAKRVSRPAIGALGALIGPGYPFSSSAMELSWAVVFLSRSSTFFCTGATVS